MMKIFDFFAQYKQKKQRREELEFNRKMAEMNRQAVALKRQADRFKEEAVRWEQSGDHKQAVAAAAAAANHEKNYLAVQNAMQTCKNMHVQVKSQKALKKLLASCAETARQIGRDVESVDVVQTQNDFVQTMEALEQSRDNLEAAQEGFAADTEVRVRNDAGEQALAQIMKERAPKAEPVRLEEPKMIPAVVDAQHKEWADDRRRILADLAMPV